MNPVRECMVPGCHNLAGEFSDRGADLRVCRFCFDVLAGALHIDRRLKSMRELTSHKVNGLNESLKIEVLDSPGYGNANHAYCISFDKMDFDGVERIAVPISFQNGPIIESGVNGISNEALLAIVEDRLDCFQAGPFACRENAVALTKIQEALMWLQKRTLDRIRRGVEGTSEK